MVYGIYQPSETRRLEHNGNNHLAGLEYTVNIKYVHYLEPYILNLLLGRKKS